MTDDPAEADPEGECVPGPQPSGPHPKMSLVISVAITALAVGVAWPIVTTVREWLRAPRRFAGEPVDLVTAVSMAMVQIGWAAWVFVMGSAVGSFLNVVVHRLPARRSVVFGHSACPRCGVGIRPRDNVPIFGWLLLGGRCRHCKTLIDARYPLIEASIAGFCLALCYAELLSGGAALPIPDRMHDAAMHWTVLDATWDLVGLYLYHVAAVMLVVAWSLIAVDRRRIPAGHVAIVLLVMGLLPVAFPFLHPVPLVHPTAAVASGLAGPEWLWRGLLVSLAGMAVGNAVGAGFARFDRGGLDAGFGVASSFALVGAVFGWQTVVVVALLAVVITAIRCGWARCVGHRGRLTPEVSVLVAAVVHLFLWRWIVAAWSAAVVFLRTWAE